MTRFLCVIILISPSPVISPPFKSWHLVCLCRFIGVASVFVPTVTLNMAPFPPSSLFLVRSPLVIWFVPFLTFFWYCLSYCPVINKARPQFIFVSRLQLGFNFRTRASEMFSKVNPGQRAMFINETKLNLIRPGDQCDLYVMPSRLYSLWCSWQTSYADGMV